MFNSNAVRATSRIDFAQASRARHFPTRPAKPAIVPGLFHATPSTTPAPMVFTATWRGVPLTALAARLAS